MHKVICCISLLFALLSVANGQYYSVKGVFNQRPNGYTGTIIFGVEYEDNTSIEKELVLGDNYIYDIRMPKRIYLYEQGNSTNKNDKYYSYGDSEFWLSVADCATNFTVYTPALIEAVYFVDENNNATTTNYSCNDRLCVKIRASKISEFFHLYITPGDLPDYEPGVNEAKYTSDAEYDTIITLADNNEMFHYVYIERSEVAKWEYGGTQALNFFVESAVNTPMGNRSFVAKKTELHFLPKYPYKHTVQVVVDSTLTDNPIELQIPKLDETPYQITLQKDPTQWAFNFYSGDLVNNASEPYVISSKTKHSDKNWRGLAPILYNLVIEYYDGETFNCPFQSSFFIPEINYGLKKTIDGRDVHVKQAGDTAEVTLTFACLNDEKGISFQFTDNDNPITPITTDSTKSTRLRIVKAGYQKVPVTEYKKKFRLTVGVHNLTIVPSTVNPVPVKIKMAINAPNPISFNTPITTDFKCHSNSDEGGKTGSISISGITGGLGNYHYKIDNGKYQKINGKSKRVDVDTLGSHTITIADSCSNFIGYNTKTVSFTINEPALIKTTTVKTNSSMSCSNDGAITLNNIQGGAGSYQYAFDGGGFQSSNVLTNLLSGSSHAYKIKDANECVVEGRDTLGITPKLAIQSYTPVAPINCCSQGSIEITFTNQIGSLSAELVNGDPSMSVATNGNKVTITGNANSKADRLKVTDSNNGLSCTINIVDSASTTDINVDDTRDLTIPDFPGIKASVYSSDNVANYGEATGVIKVRVSDAGSCSYTYQLNEESPIPPSTSEKEHTFDNLSGAPNPNGKKYYIKITSGTCEKKLEGTIFGPPSPLTLAAEETKPIDCHGNATGEVTLTPSGGWGQPFEYSDDHTNWQTENKFTKGVGTHTFYVKDSGGGISSTQITLTEPDPLGALLSTQHNVECQGTATGWLKYSVSGGTMPYLFGEVDPTKTEASSLNENQYLTAKNLLKGDYALTIKDSRGCEFKTQAQTITEPDKLILTFNSLRDITHEKCENKNNGIIQSSAKGGTLPYTYNVTTIGGDLVKEKELNDISTFVADGLPPAGYQLTVTDKMACEDNFALITINEYTNPLIKNAIVDSVICHGQKNGTIKIEAQSGTTNEITKYWWKLVGDSLVNTTGQFKELLAGEYDLYVADNQNCISLNPFRAVVHQPKVPLSISQSRVIPVISKGSATGIIQASVAGGNDGIKNIRLQDFKHVDVDNQNINDGFAFRIDSLYAGKYMMWAMDRKGCDYHSDSIEVIEPEKALSFEVIEREDALCKAPTGKFKVEGFGGWGDYIYRLSGNGDSYSSLQSRDGLHAGSYLVSVKDKMGAEYTDAVIIDEPRDSLKVTLRDKTLPTCANNGALTLGVKGGSAPYRLVYNKQADTICLATAMDHTFPNRPAGVFELTALDQNGCRFDMETQLDTTHLLRIVALEVLYPATSGGQCHLNASTRGGALPLQYEWRNSTGVVMQQKNQTLADVPSDLYALTVTDALGCSKLKSGYLPSLSDTLLVIDSQRGETGYEKHNGFVVLKSPLKTLTQVDWIDSENVSHSLSLPSNLPNVTLNGALLTLSGLKGGSYSIVVTDTDKHKAYVSVTIDTYHEFKFSRIETRPVKQPGESTGSIAAEVTGGVGPWQFTWIKTDDLSHELPDTTAGTQSFCNGLDAGTYWIVATDAYNNIITRDEEILEPASKLTLGIARYSHESCRDSVDAWVQLKATGGWGDYQFRHDDETYYSNSSSRQKLNAHTHTFYLVDKQGVVTDTTLTITQPGYLRAKVTRTDSVTCFEQSDGNIFFDIKGGTAPYKFAFDSIPNAWIQDTVARNQPARDYRFFVSDAHNCISLDTLTAQLRQPDPLLFTLQDVTHTTCDTDNGQIKVALKGGTRPYRYQWTDINTLVVGTDSVVTNLKRSSYYHLNVYDQNKCNQQFNQIIRPSTLPQVNQVNTTPVICFGDPTGTATVAEVIAADPYAPFSFKWSNDSTGITAKGFNAGINHVAVTDTNGCTTTKYFEVSTPDSLWASVAAFKDAHCYSYNDGYVEVSPHGGAGNYRYRWSNGDTLARASNLSKGNYRLLINDKNGCSRVYQYPITEPEKLMVNLGDDILICPGNTYTFDGQAFTTHQWSNYTGVISHERYAHVNDPCDYYLQVTNSIGCYARDTINLSIGNDALKADFLMTSEASQGDTLMIFELSNMQLDSLKWEYEPVAFSDITDNTAADYILNLKTLENGIYNVTLWAYSGGCMANAVKQVEVVDGNDSIPGESVLGYKDPLIRSLIVSPNPSDGTFAVTIELREMANVTLVLYSIDSGTKIDERNSKGDKYYEIPYRLNGLNTGVYVIMLTAENERRQVKLIIK